jgi:hypothetical protein
VSLGGFVWLIDLYEQRMMIESLASTLLSRIEALEQQQPVLPPSLLSRIEALEQQQPVLPPSLLSRIEALEQQPVLPPSLLSRIEALEQRPESSSLLLSRIEALERGTVGAELTSVKDAVQGLFQFRLDATNILFMEQIKCVKKDWDTSLVPKLADSQLTYICDNIKIFVDGVYKYLRDFIDKRCKEHELGVLCKVNGFNLEEHQHQLAKMGGDYIDTFVAAAKRHIAKRQNYDDFDNEDICYDDVLFPSEVVEKSPLHAVLKNETYAKKKEEEAKHEARMRIVRMQKEERAKRARDLEEERKATRKRLLEIETEQQQLQSDAKFLRLDDAAAIQSKDT